MFLRCLDETEPYSVEQWIKREQKEERCSSLLTSMQERAAY